MPSAGRAPRAEFPLLGGVVHRLGEGFHLSHGTSAGRGQLDSLCLGCLDSFFYQFAKMFERFDGGGAVAHAARGEKVRAVAHVELVVIAPANKRQVAVLRFHECTCFSALRTCFSW